MFGDLQFGLIQGAGEDTPPEKRIYGVALATVINNLDPTGEARVMLMLPWLPSITPWARVAVPMAGTGRGMYFVPQIGDEVLVAFDHGDVREPFVIGSLWNTLDRPPVIDPTGPVTTRKIRTPLGHELTFDEALQSVTLSSNTQSTVTLDPTKAEISTPLAKVSIGKAGDVTISGATKITLDAPIIEIKAKTVLNAQSNGSATFSASGTCFVKGALVQIN